MYTSPRTIMWKCFAAIIYLYQNNNYGSINPFFKEHLLKCFKNISFISPTTPESNDWIFKFPHTPTKAASKHDFIGSTQILATRCSLTMEAVEFALSETGYGNYTEWYISESWPSFWLITVWPIVITLASYEFKGYRHKITKPSLKPLRHVRYLVPWKFTK